jgi:Tol biopolymer transport system component
VLIFENPSMLKPMKKTVTLYFSILLFVVQISDCDAQVAATLTMWKDSAMGPVWNEATKTVAYGKPDAQGYYKIYLSDADGSNERPLTFAGWRTDRHQMVEEWHPSGDYLFCYVEKDTYAVEPNHTRIPDDAIPGYGGYTDIWLIKRDGSQAWPLTNLPNNYDSGVLHGAISSDGTTFAWTQRIKAPGPWWDFNLNTGTNVFKVADFTLTPTPAFSNIRTYQPGNVDAGGELESISNDKNTLLFYSTFESKNIVATPLYALNLTTGVITRLTTKSFSQCPTFTPDNTHIVYMTGDSCDIFPWEVQGADWWVMKSDSTEKIRLTYMNITNHPQSVNHYRLAGSLTFLSNTSFLGGVMTNPAGLVGYIAKVSYDNIYSGRGPDITPVFFRCAVYPNPVINDAHLQIIASVPTLATINLFDFRGQLITQYSSRLNAGENEVLFDLSSCHLESGVYLFQVISGNASRTVTVIKQ